MVDHRPGQLPGQIADWFCFHKRKTGSFHVETLICLDVGRMVSFVI